MPATVRAANYICSRCLRARATQARHCTPHRAFSSSTHSRDNGTATAKSEEKERGALSARLEQMSEEALEQGGSGARKAVQEAGFDPELKARLEERIAGANFRNKHANILAQAELPAHASKHTRDIAGAAAWSGTESVEDASLRMLNDAYKPLRGSRGSTPGPRMPTKVDTGRSRSVPNTGARLANARDRTSIYQATMDSGMTAEEKEQYRKEMKARFAPGARSIPATLQGLASLANERIEDAISRGQFKNLPRGKGKHTERDYAANSPFLDTTEYFMNKIIQRQEIVPPWIEKQQELLSTANKFRARLRNEWKRHAARMIASKGGSLEQQIARARAYAAAEAIVNPPRNKVETLDAIRPDGHLSQITLTGQLKLPDTPGGEPVEAEIKVKETPITDENAAPSSPTPPIDSDGARQAPLPSPTIAPAAHPFRDPDWERNEYSFHKLTVENLNSICRTYNLIAPQMAQKPYYNLERELKNCFADVAPLLPSEILDRATRPKVKVEVITHSQGSFLEQNFRRQATRVYDENLRVKGYGFRQFWRDLWRRDDEKAV